MHLFLFVIFRAYRSSNKFKMLHDVEFTTLLIWAVLLTAQANYDPKMDDILFSMNWPGPADMAKQAADAVDQSGDHTFDGNTIFMTTAQNERYKCLIPDTLDAQHLKAAADEYDGPDEYELLTPLLEQTSCSYRIETYWTYELCHGKHLRQYHEEKEINKKPKLQEYFLGRFDRKTYEAKKAEEVAEKEQPKEEEGHITPKSPKHKVLGLEISYFALNYTDGTPCDLTGHHRRASIRYVCQEDGKGEIYELKEMSTCEYEVVILTSAMCSHPKYGPKKDPVNKIQCHSLDGSPRKPMSLTELEEASASSRYNRKEFWQGDPPIPSPDKSQGTPYQKIAEETEDEAKKSKNRRIRLKYWWDEEEEDLLDDDLEDEDQAKPNLKPEVPKKETSHSGKERPKTVISAATDKQLLNEFLSGEYCIQGGTGWWKHEFCYGKKVVQYHDDRQTAKVLITLGQWDEEEHKTWLRKNPSKKPKPIGERKSISQYYGLGDVCDLIKRPRFVEVKLKCKENPSQPHAVAIYLIEPNTCEYTLVVESPILCDIVANADEFGLVALPKKP